MRLIDADALIETFDPQHYYDWYTPSILENIDNAPTVDAVPVVHAKWIAQNEGLTRFMCSHCKSENHEGFETYCPKCGARMDLR